MPLNSIHTSNDQDVLIVDGYQSVLSTNRDVRLLSSLVIVVGVMKSYGWVLTVTDARTKGKC